MVICIGPLATRNCEPRQARKGATTAVDVCAGVGTVWVATITYTLIYSLLLNTCREAILMYDQCHKINITLDKNGK